MQEDHARRRRLEAAALAVPSLIRGRYSFSCWCRCVVSMRASSCCTIGWAKETELTPAQAPQHIYLLCKWLLPQCNPSCAYLEAKRPKVECC